MQDNAIRQSSWASSRTDYDHLAIALERREQEIEARLAAVNERNNRQMADLHARIDRIQLSRLEEARWTVVATIAFFGTINAILVGIGQLGL